MNDDNTRRMFRNVPEALDAIDGMSPEDRQELDDFLASLKGLSKAQLQAKLGEVLRGEA